MMRFHKNFNYTWLWSLRSVAFVLSLVALEVYALPHRATRNVNVKLPEIHDSDKFYYFGFGSNMLAKRIHIQNPTAEKIGVGLLKNYSLDFNSYTARWLGAPATIVDAENSTVYGTVWDIELSNLDDIDDQEGVPEGIYRAISVPIILTNQTMITARAYQLVEQPRALLNSFTKDNVPVDRQPSKTYLQCLVKGAIESGITDDYVVWLKSIKHNGKVASDLENYLELNDVELNS